MLKECEGLTTEPVSAGGWSMKMSILSFISLIPLVFAGPQFYHFYHKPWNVPYMFSSELYPQKLLIHEHMTAVLTDGFHSKSIIEQQS